MDEGRFDDASRQLAGGMNRRRGAIAAAAALVGALRGAPAAASGRGAEAAASGKDGQKHGGNGNGNGNGSGDGSGDGNRDHAAVRQGDGDRKGSGKARPAGGADAPARACVSHRAANPACEEDADCCGGQCRGGECRCLNRTLPCERSADCCDGRACREGRCGAAARCCPAAAPTCRRTTEATANMNRERHTRMDTPNNPGRAAAPARGPRGGKEGQPGRG
ncbi:MAG: hypothetical protein ACKOWF_13560 [Chloroflexota bacterium]